MGFLTFFTTTCESAIKFFKSNEENYKGKDNVAWIRKTFPFCRLENITQFKANTKLEKVFVTNDWEVDTFNIYSPVIYKTDILLCKQYTKNASCYKTLKSISISLVIKEMKIGIHFLL